MLAVIKAPGEPPCVSEISGKPASVESVIGGTARRRNARVLVDGKERVLSIYHRSAQGLARPNIVRRGEIIRGTVLATGRGKEDAPAELTPEEARAVCVLLERLDARRGENAEARRREQNRLARQRYWGRRAREWIHTASVPRP